VTLDTALIGLLIAFVVALTGSIPALAVFVVTRTRIATLIAETNAQVEVNRTAIETRSIAEAAKADARYEALLLLYSQAKSEAAAAHAANDILQRSIAATADTTARTAAALAESATKTATELGALRENAVQRIREHDQMALTIKELRAKNGADGTQIDELKGLLLIANAGVKLTNEQLSELLDKRAIAKAGGTATPATEAANAVNIKADAVAAAPVVEGEVVKEKLA